MLKSLYTLRRGLRTCLRSFRASLQGPERGTARMRRVFTSLSPQQLETLPKDLDDCARLYFRKKAFNRTKYMISKAQRSIDMQMFIWRADHTGREFAELLVNAAERGVVVTVRKEIVGDVFELPGDFAATKDDKHPIWKAFWSHPRITVLHENNHDHSKTYIIDDETLLVSSMNIGDAYCNDWHECTVELRGKQFVEQYRNDNATLTPLGPDGSIQVLRSSAEHPMLQSVLRLLESAQKSIRIEMAYFSNPQIVELLAKKTHEGVYVFLVLPHSPGLHHHANLAAAATMLGLSRRHRAFVFRYPRGLLHTKMIIVDRRTLFIGSTNLITSSLVKMGETNVLIHRHPASCLRLARRTFTRDAIQSVQVETEQLTRSWWQKFLSRMGF